MKWAMCVGGPWNGCNMSADDDAKPGVTVAQRGRYGHGGEFVYRLHAIPLGNLGETVLYWLPADMKMKSEGDIARDALLRDTTWSSGAREEEPNRFINSAMKATEVHPAPREYILHETWSSGGKLGPGDTVDISDSVLSDRFGTDSAVVDGPMMTVTAGTPQITLTWGAKTVTITEAEYDELIAALEAKQKAPSPLERRLRLIEEKLEHLMAAADARSE